MLTDCIVQIESSSLYHLDNWQTYVRLTILCDDAGRDVSARRGGHVLKLNSHFRLRLAPSSIFNANSDALDLYYIFETNLTKATYGTLSCKPLVALCKVTGDDNLPRPFTIYMRMQTLPIRGRLVCFHMNIFKL